MEIINIYAFRHMHQGSDFRFDGHRHGRYEANIVLRGTIELTCDGNIYTVAQGSFAIWKPGVFHMSRVVGDGAELISIELDLSDDGFPREDSAVFALDSSDMLLAQVMCKTDGEALKKLTEAFLIRLSDREGSAVSDKTGLSGIYHTAVKFMASSISSDIDVTHIAKHCGVCTTTLKKAFSEYAGRGVKAYLNGMRIHTAKELLKKGTDVAQVSDTLGFSSPAYFSQCFKREVGISPQKYKLLSNFEKNYKQVPR